MVLMAFSRGHLPLHFCNFALQIDVDDNEATASAANIAAVPTFVAFDKGAAVRK